MVIPIHSFGVIKLSIDLFISLLEGMVDDETKFVKLIKKNWSGGRYSLFYLLRQLWEYCETEGII